MQRRPVYLLNTWIALLRGVNVLGSHKLPMRDLAALLEDAGFGSVRTYIQSGNVVFHSSRGTARTHAARIAQLIRGRYGFEPHVMVLSARQLAAAIRSNPFPRANSDHKSLHLFFLAGRPQKPDLESLGRLKKRREAFALRGAVFYLHTPDGFPDSAIRSRVDRCLGVPASARNWRTVTRLLEMAQRREAEGQSAPSARR